MKMNAKVIVGSVVLVAVLVGIGVSCMRGETAGERNGSADAQVRRPAGTQVEQARKPKKQGARQRPQRAKPVKPHIEVAEDDDAMTPQERALTTRIEKALDEEKLEDAVACAKEALASKNPEVRQAMVDTLGWFGEKALPELTPFLADPDEDVRDSAMNEWSMAVSQIENEAEKLGVVELAMNVLTDEDALEDISGEYIGVDEKLAVESLVRLIEANGSAAGVAKAKETYEFVTGDEWTSSAAAAKWIAEEYQPDDAGDAK